MNVAYKHLDAKLRIAEFTLVQWMGLVFGVALALIWGFYVSPLGPFLTMASAIYLGAIPVGMVLLAAFYEVDVLLVVRAAIGWKRLEGRFVPGAGTPAGGYVVHPEAVHDQHRRRDPYDLKLEDLWQS